MIASFTRRRRRPVVTLSLGALVCLTALVNAQTGKAPSTAPAASKAGIVKREVEGGYFLVPVTEHPALPAEVTRAFVIPIHGPIDEILFENLKRKALQCRGKGAELVIFDMNTPGGAMGPMLEIISLIQKELKDIYTVAFVTEEAISAGAIISLACDEIIMQPDTRLGDAMPVMIGPEGYVEIPEKERGKIESYMRVMVRNLAKRGGYSEILCEAMITLSLEVWSVRNTRTGEMQFVDAELWTKRASAGPKATGGPVGGTQAQGPLSWKDPEGDTWEYVDTADAATTVLTMNPDEAVFNGFVRVVVKDMKALKAHYHIGTEPEVLGDSAAETFVMIMNGPWVQGLLMLGLVFFGYIEMHTPGFGIFGSLAIACLVMIVASRFIIGTANAIEIVVLLIGVILLALEIFVIPGFGVAGIAGIVLIVAALAAMLIPNAPTKLPLPETDLDWSLLADGLVTGLLGAIGGIVLSVVFARYLPAMPGANKLFLKPPPPDVEPALEDSSVLLEVSAGDTGVVESPCRPSGKARFGETLLDVVSQGSIIAAGKTVRVLQRHGNEIVVEEV